MLVLSRPLFSTMVLAEFIIIDAMASSFNIIVSYCTCRPTIGARSTWLRLLDTLMTDCVGAVLTTTCLFISPWAPEYTVMILFLFGGNTGTNLNGTGAWLIV